MPKIELTGLSSTGSKHGLLVERDEKGAARFVVTGNNGKRHAAVALTPGDTEKIATFLSPRADGSWED
jgi:hypothetical protein